MCVHSQCTKVLALGVHEDRLSLVSLAKEPLQRPDGRHARAERTRDAIVGALLALLEEGVMSPPAELVAERAGVSRRVLFNHFKDREDLLTRAAARRFETIVALRPELPLEGSTETRARAFFAAIGRFYDHVAPVRRAALLFAHESAVITSHMAEATRMHRAAAAAVFAPEIEAAAACERESLARALAAVTSFSFWDELRRNQELSFEASTRALERFVEGLFVHERRSAKA
jgi:AcrR family transcriptional regulator